MNAAALDLNNMTDSYEWASNFTTYLITLWVGGSGIQHIVVPVMGNGGCDHANMGAVAGMANQPGVGINITGAYRCVH